MDTSSLLRPLVVVLAVATLSACGVAHHNVLVPYDSKAGVTTVSLLPTIVDSRESTPDALELNEKWRQMAPVELRRVLGSLTVAEGAPHRIQSSIDVEYGNRALRYFAGNGAGSGHVTVTLRLLAQDDHVLCETYSRADLSVGLFGGSMEDVVRDAIRGAAESFAQSISSGDLDKRSAASAAGSS